jgi:hypothetical protein
VAGVDTKLVDRKRKSAQPAGTYGAGWYDIAGWPGWKRYWDGTTEEWKLASIGWHDDPQPAVSP